MLRHYFTLKRIASELKQLEGFYLEEIFTQEKDSAVFEFSDGANHKFVQVYTDPQKASISLRTNLARAKKNTTDILQALQGDVLQNVYVIKNDRIIKMEYIYSNLYVIMFNAPHTNLIVTKKNNEIIETLNKTTLSPGDTFNPNPPVFKDFTDHPGFTAIFPALSSSELMLGKYYAAELLQRLNINPETKLGALDVEALNDIRKEANNIINECLYGSNSYILKDKNDNLLLSLIPLNNYEITEEFVSVSDAVRRKFIDSIKEKKFDHLQKDLRKKLERQFDKVSKVIWHIKNKDEIQKRIENYRLFGDLLMAQPNPHSKGMDLINVIDFSGNDINVPLDPKLSQIDNAKFFYEKAKKGAEAMKKNEERIPIMEERLRRIQNLINKVDSAESSAFLERLNNDIGRKRDSKMATNDKNPSGKFKEFDLGGGFILYVGKNAANNDELTVKFAKPDDLWLHARGASGSHCVLRWSGTEKPPKEIMQKSAALAAYYSQARKGKHVPVAYTLKKYVRKPKGAHPGSVVMAREDVILVDPKSPEELGFKED